MDVVLHSAAETNWRGSRETIVRTNVTGTRNMLDLATRAGAPLYYVSTAFVARTPAADRPTGASPAPPPTSASKIGAEQMVRRPGCPGTSSCGRRS